MATELGKAYVQIIPSAKGIAGTISSELSGEVGSAGEAAGLQLVGKLKGVIGAAAIGTFLADSISTGAEFDKAISQIAATMGLSMDEMAQQVGTVDLAWGTFSGNLREYAQEMGANTAFSASQSAEALNYMALAGYDVQTSMEMLPNVLNLAAAGAMDLGLASDMVTDTQTALGLDIARTTQLVDEMAKTASTTNTSVTQLGDAMLTIGATARNLSDGFFTLESGEQLAYDGTQSLSMALGVLADNGIKGSEGGTHLRNMIMSLTSPTDKASATMEALGLQIYDTDGEMRPFISILGDMNIALDEMTEEEKTNAIATIFNKTDIASVNALLGTSEDRWLEVGQAILGAEGAAQQMADTQLDNLAGDVTLFKSALEGVQIAVSDFVAPALREVVQLGSGLLSGITTALQSGDMSGLLAVGQDIVQMVADGIEQAPQKYLMLLQMVQGIASSISEALPGLLETGTGMVQGVLDGITASLPSILNEGIIIITNIANGILTNLPMLITTAGQLITSFATFLMTNFPLIMQKGMELIFNLVNGIIANLPQIIASVTKVIFTFIATIVQNLPQIYKEGITLLGKLIAGIITTIPKLIVAAVKIITDFKQQFDEFDWVQIGIDILLGIRDGIMAAVGEVIDAAKAAAESIWTAVKNVFQISSPSKLMAYAGEMIDAGLAVGIIDNKGMIENAMASLGNSTVSSLQVSASYGDFETTEQSNRIDTLVDMLSDYLPVIASGENQKVVLEADAGRMFRVMQRESVRNTTLVGTNAVLAST